MAFGRSDLRGGEGPQIGTESKAALLCKDARSPRGILFVRRPPDLR